MFRYTDRWSDRLQETATTIAHERGLRLHGTAFARAQAALDAQLSIKAEEPPPCHANIIGWPVVVNNPALQKARQKERAILIAQQARLLLLA